MIAAAEPPAPAAAPPTPPSSAAPALPAPAAQPVASAAVPGDAPAIWARAGELASGNRRLRKLASEVRAVELKADALVIEADAEHFGPAEGSLAEFADLASRAAGRRITIALRRAAAPAAAPAPAAPTRDSLAEAAAIPVVRRVIELFNAQVRTVKPRTRPAAGAPERSPPAE